jgi:hypothetical protein
MVRTVAVVAAADCVIRDTRSRIGDLRGYGKPFA